MRIQERRLHWVTLARSSWPDSTASPCRILTVTPSSFIIVHIQHWLLSALRRSWQSRIEWQLCYWTEIFPILYWVSVCIVLHKIPSLWVLLSFHTTVFMPGASCQTSQQTFVCFCDVTVWEWSDILIPPGIKTTLTLKALHVLVQTGLDKVLHIPDSIQLFFLSFNQFLFVHIEPLMYH